MIVIVIVIGAVIVIVIIRDIVTRALILVSVQCGPPSYKLVIEDIS